MRRQIAPGQWVEEGDQTPYQSGRGHGGVSVTSVDVVRPRLQGTSQLSNKDPNVAFGNHQNVAESRARAGEASKANAAKRKAAAA